MQNKIVKGISCFSMLLITHTASAQGKLNDIRVIAGLSIGYSEFSFPEKLDHSISFPTANLPIALTMTDWQLSLNASTSLSDGDIAEEEDLGQASRNDLDLTLGYRLNQNWTVFAGYKYGKTKMTFVPRDFDENDEEEEEEEKNELTQTYDSYKQTGPFLGVSYNWQFEKAGSLSLSLGYAMLNATNDFSANTDEEEEDDLEAPEFDDLTGRNTGDTDGFSYAISWTMPLSSNLLFQTRFKVNDYQQDIVVDGQRYKDIDETFSTLQVGIAYVF